MLLIITHPGRNSSQLIFIAFEVFMFIFRIGDAVRGYRAVIWVGSNVEITISQRSCGILCVLHFPAQTK